MNDQLKALLDLREIDSELFLMFDLREKRPLEMQKEVRKLREAEAERDRVQAAIREKRMECDRGELEVKNNLAEAEKLQVALNSAKSNEEYQVLRGKLDRLEKVRGELEEGILEGFNQIDALGEEKKAAEGRIEEVRREVDERQRELEAFMKELEDRISGLEKRREAALDRVSKDAFDVYRRVLERYRESAMALVENGVCQGCYMSITKQLLNQLLLGRDIVQCQNCMRILYVDA